MKVLLSEEQLRDGIEQMAADINDRYRDQPLTIIGVMTGSIVMMADLIRLLQMPLRVGVVQTSSYQGTQRGSLRINADLMPDIQGRDVLLVDDIFDTGNTLLEVVRLMEQLRPTSVRTAVLLRKVGRQEVTLEPDYSAFEIPDKFVIGYGLDYLDEYRNLPHVAYLEESDLAERSSG